MPSRAEKVQRPTATSHHFGFAPHPGRHQLEVNQPGDRDEHEAEHTADEVLRGGTPRFTASPVSQAEEPLSASVRGFFEPRFGHDFSQVRIHADPIAANFSHGLAAEAFTVRNNIYFGASQYRPETPSGRHLLAHELTHVVQQRRTGVARVQRQPAVAAPAAVSPFAGPLTASEWEVLTGWLTRGAVGFDALTDDPIRNAELVAAELFCQRTSYGLSTGQKNEDPLLCLISDVTRADPRVQALVPQVTARGPIIHWPAVPENRRFLYVMERLVNVYHFPVNGAAGVVGNLWAESFLIPSIVEGSNPATPMRGTNQAGQTTDFTAEHVMNRTDPQSPRMPGVGLAQWTSGPRRSGLFQHGGLGSAILFNMDSQIDYLVNELQTNYPGVYGVVTGAGVAVDTASDDVVYRFEVPGAVLDGAGGQLPRTDPQVQGVFRVRRGSSQRALRIYNEAHP